ncbi:MAG: sugar phosphate nucleotidyltransferase [Kiritimatiellia bacterium]
MNSTDFVAQIPKSCDSSHAAKPTKAIVLAAGYGKRMYPLTLETPKPLLTLWGHPILEHLLGLLFEWGVREVLINLHHRADRLVEHILSHPVRGMRIALSFESEILGTGGMLARARWFLDTDHPFWLVNSDIVIDLDPTPLLTAFRARNPLAVLWMHPTLGPRTVEVRRGLIINFRSPCRKTAQRFTLCGLHLISPQILRYVPSAEQFASIIDIYESAMRAGERIIGVSVPSAFWADMGTPQNYLDSHRRSRLARLWNLPGARLYSGVVDASVTRGPGRARVIGFACVASDAKLGRRTTLYDTVLMAGARTIGRCTLREAILAPGVRISGTAEGLWCKADGTDISALPKVLRKIEWPPDRCAISLLGPRGSGRRFIRVALGSRRAIVILYEPTRPENVRYAACASFLRHHGVSVPRLLLHDPTEQVTVIEDLGDASLQRLAATGKKSRLRQLYGLVLEQMALLHTRATKAAERERPELAEPFSRAVYQYEHDLFLTRFARDHLRLPASCIAPLRRELTSLVGVLAHERRVLIHRDFQSSNVIFRRGRPFLIDFQGMRFGPAAYDLASLLCDPYVCLPESLQIEMLGYYARLVKRSLVPLNRVFWYAAVQRLAQALGAFARFTASPETGHFARFIEPGLRMMRRALTHVEGLEELKQLVLKCTETLA